tara:strand:+ start:1760 stop:2005 length:246 start_codon:yes stop_codon:yes gene_type:complete
MNEKYKKFAEESMFLGKKMIDMTKDELLEIIGWMHFVKEKTLKEKEQEHKFFMDVEKANNATPRINNPMPTFGTFGFFGIT